MLSSNLFQNPILLRITPILPTLHWGPHVKRIEAWGDKGLALLRQGFEGLACHTKLHRSVVWCREPDSNRHGLYARGILSPLRLPIPPSRHYKCLCFKDLNDFLFLSPYFYPNSVALSTSLYELRRTYHWEPHMKRIEAWG